MPPMQLAAFTVVVTAKGAGVSRAATGTATLTVKDGSGKVVAGAVVTGSWTGAVVSSPLTGTTNVKGMAVIRSAPTKTTGTLTFTVTSITKAGLLYTPDSNAVANPQSGTWQ